jgi:alanine-synthesizing transaminase
VYNTSTLREISDFASENNLPIISDEIYDKITYETPFTNISIVARDNPIIGLNGF